MINDTGLRYVFVTASPVLTNEVRRFYGGLKDQLINHLRAKELNQMKKDDQGSDEEFTIVEEPKQLTAEDLEKKELLDFIQMQERDAEESNQMQ
jgi:hypothetical protein